MKTLLTLLFLAIAAPVFAQTDIGYWQRPDCGTLSPLANATVCLQTTTASGRTEGHLYIYRSGGWEDVDTGGAGSGDITSVTAGTNLTGGGVTGAVTLNVANPVVADLTGTASFATALANNGSDCSAGLAARGVDASGAAENCFDVATQAELDAHTSSTSAHTAANIVVTPFASIAATTVQAALQEIVSETAIDQTATYAWTGPNSYTKLRLIPVTVATLPASPSDGQLARINDGATASSCEQAGGTFVVTCGYNALTGHWEPIGSSGSTSTLQEIADSGRAISNAVDPTTAVKTGNGVIFFADYCDSANRCKRTTVNAAGAEVASDWAASGMSGKQIIFYDNAGTPLFQWDNDTGGLVRAVKGTQAQGDVLYFNGTAWVRLAPGTAGFALHTGGAAANPAWAATGTILSAGDSGGNFACASTTYFALAQHFSHTTESNVESRVPRAGTATNLYVDTVAIPAGQTVVWTLRKAGGDTALTCTQTATQTQCSDTSNTVTFAQGDKIAIKGVCSGGVTAVSPVNVTLLLR